MQTSYGENALDGTHRLENVGTTFAKGDFPDAPIQSHAEALFPSNGGQVERAFPKAGRLKIRRSASWRSVLQLVVLERDP